MNAITHDIAIVNEKEINFFAMVRRREVTKTIPIENLFKSTKHKGQK